MHTLFQNQANKMLDILIILILVVINGFFSLSEVALISARKGKLQALAREGNRSARQALLLMEDPDRFLSTAQIGITIVSILTGIYSGAALSDRFGAILQTWGMNASSAHFTAKTIIVVVATYLQCCMGELVPKRIGIDFADRMARLCAPPMMLFSKLSFPAVWLLTKNTEGFIRVFRLHHTENKVTEEEIKSVIQEGTDAGEVQEVEQDIMERALVLGDQTVDSLMTHRNDLVTLDIGMTAAEVEAVIRQTPYATYPVIDEDLDNVQGIVTLKDLVLILGREDFSLKSIIKEPHYFPENMTVYKALEQLKADRLNRALVCDEFGSLQGIISLKDILEGLVGSIAEPSEAPDIVEQDDHRSWLVSGQCLFYDFLAWFDAEDYYTPDFTTVGGLILDLLERIPHEGEQVEWRGFQLTVQQMDGQRIDKVLVRKTEPEDISSDG